MNSQIDTEDDRWRQAILSLDSTIKQACENLALAEVQIVLVVDQNGVLIGTITDGDVRRALLRGLTVNNPIDTLIERNAMVVPPQMSREMAMGIMLANKIRQLPVVDEDRRIIS